MHYLVTLTVHGMLQKLWSWLWLPYNKMM